MGLLYGKCWLGAGNIDVNLVDKYSTFMEFTLQRKRQKINNNNKTKTAVASNSSDHQELTKEANKSSNYSWECEKTSPMTVRQRHCCQRKSQCKCEGNQLSILKYPAPLQWVLICLNIVIKSILQTTRNISSVIIRSHCVLNLFAWFVYCCSSFRVLYMEHEASGHYFCTFSTD